MTQLAADNETIKGPLAGLGPVANFAILASEIMYRGGLVAIDYAGEVQMASDTLGLRVIGISPKQIDNTADGKELAPPLTGAYRLNNSATYPLTRASINQPCYVEDDNTVAGFSTNLVAAGIVVDVDADGVWVDVSPRARAIARRLALPKIVTNAAATLTITAAQAFAGNVIVQSDYATGATITLPAAQPGFRLGFQRMSATAAHDLILQAPSGDKVLGSTAAGTASNTTDAISDILYIETIDAMDWKVAFPVPADLAVWVAST